MNICSQLASGPIILHIYLYDQENWALNKSRIFWNTWKTPSWLSNDCKVSYFHFHWSDADEDMCATSSSDRLSSGERENQKLQLNSIFSRATWAYFGPVKRKSKRNDSCNYDTVKNGDNERIVFCMKLCYLDCNPTRYKNSGHCAKTWQTQ